MSNLPGMSSAKKLIYNRRQGNEVIIRSLSLIVNEKITVHLLFVYYVYV